MKTRFSEHVGSASQPCQVDTLKPVGVHFRLPGHSHSDMRVSAVEKVRSRDKFVIEARENFWIRKYKTVEKGMNIQR